MVVYWLARSACDRDDLSSNPVAAKKNSSEHLLLAHSEKVFGKGPQALNMLGLGIKKSSCKPFYCFYARVVCPELDAEGV